MARLVSREDAAAAALTAADHAVGSAYDSLDAAGLDRIVQGIAGDAHALGLGCGEDALGL